MFIWGPSVLAQAFTFTSGAHTYNENFNGMGSAGTIYPNGWTAIRYAGSGTANATLAVVVTDGSANSGAVYNVGTTTANERAFGSLASGSTVPRFGASFSNNTGTSITSLTLAGVMEQWRVGDNAVVEVVAFEYSTDATDLQTGTWTPITNFDLVEKRTTTTVAAAVDGNLPENQTGINASINLAWSSGSTLWIRWSDVNATGADALLAIDDLSITASLTIVPSIEVTAPVTGAQWEQGTTRNATWTASATNTNVKIEFTPNASAMPVVWSTVDETAVKVASAGTYAIVVPVGDVNVPVSANCQFRISDIPETAFGLSGIFSVIAPQPPVVSFTPANGATAVDITSNITIAYDVPVRNIDNSEITDTQLASLVTLKTTDAAGTAVPFTATGNPLTRTITINPDADLLNSQVYYVAVAPVEGYNDVATVAQHVNFTTVQSFAPAISAVTITETGPYLAGTAVHVNWVSANVATVKIELVETATSTVTSIATAVTASAGTASIVLPATLAYSATYAVRVTDEATVTNSQSSVFSVIAVANSLLSLRAQPVDAIVKYTGIATVTYARTSRNQKYIQDATAAILIDDNTAAPGFITGTYAIGDGITNIVGKIALYNGLIEFVPGAVTGEPATGSVIIPEVRTLASLTPADQCKLVKIENFAFKTPTQFEPTGLFVKSKNYDIDATDNTLLAYRTAFSESDYIGAGQYVPIGTISSIALVGQYTNLGVTQMQITARSWSDMGKTVDIDIVVSEKMQLSISPNPGNGDVTVTLPSKGTYDLKVFSLTGKLVHNASMSGLSGKLDLSFLPKGLYILNASNTLTGKVNSSRLVIN